MKPTYNYYEIKKMKTTLLTIKSNMQKKFNCTNKMPS